MNKIRNNKVLSLIIILFMYIIAFTAGYFSMFWMEVSPVLKLLVFDVVATLVIWVFSLIVKNSSVYDPYWSLTPWFMVTCLIISYQVFEVWSFILYIAFSIWSFRLTINWIITFDNLTWEDWRYRNYRENLSPVFFHLANFFGIQMFPTLLVFFGSVPLFYVYLFNLNSPLMLIGAAVILLGTALEFISDHHMHEFLRTIKEKKVCNYGLWNYSRHPNYLGEILIWLGAYLSLIVVMPGLWFLGFGFILIICLFEFISIPMMEKRQKERRSDYALYIKQTSRLLILPKRKL